MGMRGREFKPSAEPRAVLTQQEAEQIKRSPRGEHPLLRMQRCCGNRFVQRVVGLAEQNGRVGVGDRSGRSIHPALARASFVQRDDDGEGQQSPESGEAPAEQQAGAAPEQPLLSLERLPNFRVGVGSTLGEREFWRMMYLVPQMFNPLAAADVSHFGLYLLPETLGAGMLLEGQEEAVPPVPQAPPPQGGTSTTTSVPSSATLASLGPARFRVVFEEPSVPTPEPIRESQSRMEQAIAANQPPGLNTGLLIKGLITAFLAKTEPGQKLLQGVMQTIGSSAEEGGGEASGASVNVNVDLMPARVMQGELPMLHLGVDVSF